MVVVAVGRGGGTGARDGASVASDVPPPPPPYFSFSAWARAWASPIVPGVVSRAGMKSKETETIKDNHNIGSVDEQSGRTGFSGADATAGGGGGTRILVTDRIVVGVVVALCMMCIHTISYEKDSTIAGASVAAKAAK